MSIDEAKEKIEELEQFIQLVDQYEPVTFEQQVVYLYVIHENVTTVMGIVNERGYRIGKRKVLTTDISNILRARPFDDMHEMAAGMFRTNRRRGASKR
ncbi:MAG: hypothetical protein ABS949_10945 [Solibacillus sp.]